MPKPKRLSRLECKLSKAHCANPSPISQSTKQQSMAPQKHPLCPVIDANQRPLRVIQVLSYPPPSHHAAHREFPYQSGRQSAQQKPQAKWSPMGIRVLQRWPCHNQATPNLCDFSICHSEPLRTILKPAPSPRQCLQLIQAWWPKHLMCPLQTAAKRHESSRRRYP